MEIKSKFKNFGGEFIPDIIQYLKQYVEKDPTVTISIGCDSIQRRRKTVYAITIMLYNQDVKNGAHVVFFRESIAKVRDNFERLQKEAQYMHDIGEYFNKELASFYKRQDVTELERKKYKFHLMKCDGQYLHIPPHQEEGFVKNISLNDAEKQVEYKLVDLHLDFNPSEGTIDARGISKNKSYLSYKSYIPWLRGLGFKVYAKPLGFAATSAADLLLKE
jgi:predicted RNase H-related nuclease YkuK (DUF458 family)